MESKCANQRTRRVLCVLVADVVETYGLSQAKRYRAGFVGVSTRMDGVPLPSQALDAY